MIMIIEKTGMLKRRNETGKIDTIEAVAERETERDIPTEMIIVDQWQKEDNIVHNHTSVSCG